MEKQKPIRSAARQPPPAPAFDPFCVPEQPEISIAPTDFDTYPAAILGYLNAGGSTFGMDSVLVANGLQYNIPSTYTLDITNDGKYDVIVTIADPDDENDPPMGMILVYYCDGVSYQLGFAEYAPENGGIPTVLSTMDLNNDSVNEIVYSSSLADTFARYEQVQIISWNGAYFEKRLEGSTTSLPFPSSQATDYDKDGIYQIEMVAAAVDSVEAGPTREILHIWEYASTDGHWYHTQTIPGPSDFRIHVLQDADTALVNNDPATAILLYQQVISSPDLRDWLEPDYERAVLGAYARFKTVVAYAKMGDTTQAQAALAEMDATYESWEDTYAWLEMAQEFWQGLGTDGYEAGCDKVEEFALFYPDKVLEPISQQTFGYANLDYTPEMMCP